MAEDFDSVFLFCDLMNGIVSLYILHSYRYHVPWNSPDLPGPCTERSAAALSVALPPSAQRGRNRAIYRATTISTP
jgi:hypothetical protein